MRHVNARKRWVFRWKTKTTMTVIIVIIIGAAKAAVVVVNITFELNEAYRIHT